MTSSDPKQGGFTVTDRRSFAAEGQSKEGQPREGQLKEGRSKTTASSTAQAAPVDDPTAQPGPDEGRPDAAALPAVDFHTFVLSLGSSALLHLGELEPPEGGQPEKDLALAKHTIDILTMLETKTRGNLSAAEEKLMESLLYDLRLRYVNASK